MERCEQCGTKLRDGGLTTPTGRQLCATCGDTFVATAVGISSGDMGTAIAMGYSKDGRETTGVLGWIRRALRGNHS